MAAIKQSPLPNVFPLPGQLAQSISVFRIRFPGAEGQWNDMLPGVHRTWYEKFDAERWVYEQWYGASWSMRKCFTCMAARDTSYIPDALGHGWICQTSIKLVGWLCLKRPGAWRWDALVARSSLLPRYLNDLCGSFCIFLTTCFHLSEARSVLHRWNGVSFHLLEIMMFDLTLER